RMLVLAGPDDNYGSPLTLYALSLGATPTWSQVAVEGPGPSLREDYASATDPVGHQMLVAGGGPADSNPDGESWVLYFDGATTDVLASLVTADATPDEVRIVWQIPSAGTVTAERRIIGG